MTVVEQTSSVQGQRPIQRSWLAHIWGLVLALAVLVSALLLPTPETLPLAGYRMLAILCIAVILWVNLVRPEAGDGGVHPRRDDAVPGRDPSQSD
jgi:Sodium:sulfate symporter transmembrane region